MSSDLWWTKRLGKGKLDHMSEEQDTQQDQIAQDTSEAGLEQEAQVELAADDLQKEITLRSVVEAILFASNEPLEASKIAKVAGAGDARQVRKLIEELNGEYSERGSAYHIEQIAGGYVMLTLPEYNDWLKQLLPTRQESKLSQAALETLAIVAYKQPVMRVTVEAIRFSVFVYARLASSRRSRPNDKIDTFFSTGSNTTR